MAYYVLDEHGNKVEAYDKQGVLALLEQAIEDGDLESIAVDSAFVDKLKCCVGAGTHYIAFVTQAKYNELKENEQLILDAFYFITDDNSYDNLDRKLDDLQDDIDAYQTSFENIGTQISGLSSRMQNAEDDIHAIESDYRKKSEAVQLISCVESADYIYKKIGTTPTFYNVDLDDRMEQGKTASDVVGVRGTLAVTYGTTKLVYIDFNILSNGSMMQGVGGVISDGGTLYYYQYLGAIQMAGRTINASEMKPQLLSINGTNFSNETITSVALSSLKIYYK